MRTSCAWTGISIASSMKCFLNSLIPSSPTLTTSYQVCPTSLPSESVQQHRVTFTVDPTLVDICKELNQAVPELPSPVLLAIRAACCRVANLSGALEQHDIVLRELARTQTLAPDGDHGSAELLRMRLGSSLAH
ncbi:hypothetical protein MIND_00016300 [Mycena indigotica]|uniref:Uncharacterized protein n=1 Tax=Mycena indigotica TaxID=2126181 RepID=A0A8H6TCP4_9AGAR|nr:uncharacterized protein MIND_00016300 [Mycena indigotica]KAF7315021.1 hypothetical protein MIND_00016300 [Mycena indigotica]